LFEFIRDNVVVDHVGKINLTGLPCITGRKSKGFVAVSIGAVGNNRDK
jgi:hypothetical protein